MGKFVMKETKNGGVKFDLKAGNGEVIATSEAYSGDAACIDVTLNFPMIAAARNDTERPLCKCFPRNIVNRTAVSEQDVNIVADDIGNSGGRI